MRGRILAKLPSPGAVGRTVALGVPAGAALFGLSVALVGGASTVLVLAFWCAGSALVAGHAWVGEWRSRRQQRLAGTGIEPLPPVHPQPAPLDERRQRRAHRPRGADPARAGIPILLAQPEPVEKEPREFEEAATTTGPPVSGSISVQVVEEQAPAPVIAVPPAAASAAPAAPLPAPNKGGGTTKQRKRRGRGKRASGGPGQPASAPVLAAAPAAGGCA